jgi:hypothetical protein
LPFRASKLRQVARVFRERLKCLLGVLRRHARARAHLLDNPHQRLALDAVRAQDAPRLLFIFGYGQEQAVSRDVIVLELVGLFLRPVERLGRATAVIALPRPADLWKFLDRRVEIRQNGLNVDPDATQHRTRHAFGLIDHRGQNVLRLHLLMILLLG